MDVINSRKYTFLDAFFRRNVPKNETFEIGMRKIGSLHQDLWYCTLRCAVANMSI